jgi:Phage tail tube protein
MSENRAGFIQVLVDGELMDIYGVFTVGHGHSKKTKMKGSDGRPLGFKEEAQIPFIEGKILDSKRLDIGKLQSITDATITYRKPNGKTGVLQNACHASDGNETSENSEIDIRFEGDLYEEFT